MVYMLAVCLSRKYRLIFPLGYDCPVLVKNCESRRPISEPLIIWGQYNIIANKRYGTYPGSGTSRLQDTSKQASLTLVKIDATVLYTIARDARKRGCNLSVPITEIGHSRVRYLTIICPE